LETEDNCGAIIVLGRFVHDTGIAAEANSVKWVAITRYGKGFSDLLDSENIADQKQTT
jgi:hypothetical protein